MLRHEATIRVFAPPAELGSVNVKKTGHTWDFEVCAFRFYQGERFRFDGFPAKYALTFPKKIGSLSCSMSRFGKRNNSARSVVVSGSKSVSFAASKRARSARTQAPKAFSSNANSAATSVIERTETLARRAASPLNSAENLRRRHDM
jgi:hypothetical protein